MKKYFIAIITLVLCFSYENVKADVLCKRAKTLHTEQCVGVSSDENSEERFCRAAGFEQGDTITYGSLGTLGELATGDAFDCDVNGDGTYDEKTERFYYVTDIDTATAVLIYYSNVNGGVPADIEGYQYTTYSENKGPVIAVKQLPTTTQWKNISLTNSIRHIRDYQWNIFSTDFDYGDKAARFLTYHEVKAGCNDTNEATLLSKKCTFLFEGIKHANMNFKSWGWWLETRPSTTTYAHFISGASSQIVSQGVETVYGVRPAIEVPKKRIEISAIVNDNQTDNNLTEDKNDSTNITETVEVEDTAFSITKIGITIGLVVLVLGVMVIVQTLLKDKQKNQ